MTDTGTPSVEGRSGRLDPDALAALEEERDFLLASIDDLEREHAAGDVDDHDYRALLDDYTARAATVLRAIDDGRARFATAPAAPRSQRLLTIGAVVLVAVVAGVLVAQASGRRGQAGLTGLDVRSASTRLDDCIVEEQEDPELGLDCYTSVLEDLPASVEALSFRGWLQIRSFDPDDGLDDLDAAIDLLEADLADRVDASLADPSPYLFRAIGRFRSDDPIAAVGDLAAFFDADPPAEQRGLADGVAADIAEAALDACVQGEVDATISPVEAFTCYEQVLDVRPDNGEAAIYLGWLLARTGVDDDRALALLDQGLAADPAVTQGYVFRATLSAHLGETAAALADLDTFDALDAPPDQQAIADDVRAQIEAGQDPLAR